MNRRTLLASLGAGVSGLAGCAGVLGGGDADEDTLTPVSDVPTMTPQPTPPDEPTENPNVCDPDTDEYAPYAIAVRALPSPSPTFSDLGCPTFSWASRTVCYHTADIEAEPVVLVSEYHTAVVHEAGGEVLRFALVSRADERITIYPHAWSILAAPGDGQGWRSVRSGEPRCLRQMENEDVHWWEVGVHTTPTTNGINLTTPTVLLDPRTYAFVVAVSTADGTDLACVAPFVVRDAPDDIGVSTPEKPTAPKPASTANDTDN
jgi:hypothetical protein